MYINIVSFYEERIKIEWNGEQKEAVQKATWIASIHERCDQHANNSGTEWRWLRVTSVYMAKKVGTAHCLMQAWLTLRYLSLPVPLCTFFRSDRELFWVR